MTQEIALDPEADDFGPSPAVVEDAARPIVVVGATVVVVTTPLT